jgi:PiT family inorganic phosphate transporter
MPVMLQTQESPAPVVDCPSPPVRVHPLRATLNRPMGKAGAAAFGVVLLASLAFAGSNLLHDLRLAPSLESYTYALLTGALLLALFFEFVNGFHDTASAVAMVIYTRAMQPSFAVVWSGVWNFVGVIVASGTVAYTIVSLLPLDLVLQSTAATRFSMVFALLLAAILWNLGTWFFGLPSSSSHTLIGSILGIGLANRWLLAGGRSSGVNWSQAVSVFKALLFSPLIGFAGAALLFLAGRLLLRRIGHYQEHATDEPPAFWMRYLLILSCTGVSFAHGSNDGQKGMGLIMLVLIGTVPATYALNHHTSNQQWQQVVSLSVKAEQALAAHSAVPQPAAETPNPHAPATLDPHAVLTTYVGSHRLTPSVVPALRDWNEQLSQQIAPYPALAAVPAGEQSNLRNQMFLTSDALRILANAKNSPFTAPEHDVVLQYSAGLDGLTRFIPIWVKISVALAMGLGTMLGWRRVVITVGERIGQQDVNQVQAASASLVAMVTILGASRFGLPVSTTHVVASGVAGSMTAKGSGLQMSTVRNIVLAWVFTLPMSALLAGGLFFLFRLLMGVSGSHVASSM